MKVTFRQPAGLGQIFAADAFANMVGNPISITADTDTSPPWPPDQPWRVVTLVAAEVSEDGSFADLTIEPVDKPDGMLPPA